MRHKSVQRSAEVTVLVGGDLLPQIEDAVWSALQAHRLIPHSVSVNRSGKMPHISDDNWVQDWTFKVQAIDPIGTMTEDEWTAATSAFVQAVFSDPNTAREAVVSPSVIKQAQWRDADLFVIGSDFLPCTSQVSYQIASTEEGDLSNVIEQMALDYKTLSEYALGISNLSCVTNGISLSSVGVEYIVTVDLASSAPITQQSINEIETKLSHHSNVGVKLIDKKPSQQLTLDNNLVQLNQQGRITIPKDIRSELDMGSGDTLALSVQGGKLVGTPVSVIPRTAGNGMN